MVLLVITYALVFQPHMLECGHTFCHRCIVKALSASRLCPKCGVAQADNRLFPNLGLSNMISSYNRVSGVIWQTVAKPCVDPMLATFFPFATSKECLKPFVSRPR